MGVARPNISRGPARINQRREQQFSATQPDLGSQLRTRSDALLIGWYNDRFNNLHLKSSLETNEINTSAADNSLMFCDLLKRRLLK